MVGVGMELRGLFMFLEAADLGMRMEVVGAWRNVWVGLWSLCFGLCLFDFIRFDLMRCVLMDIYCGGRRGGRVQAIRFRFRADFGF